MEETASVAENQPVEDPPSFKFTWNIKNFSNLKDNKHYYSDVFFAGCYKWGVVIYLDQEHLSMYLVVADSENLPYKWCICGQFSLTVICQSDREKNIRSESETHHQFNARESCWGFQWFMPLSILGDPHGGYIVNDIVTVEAEVAVKAVYDSKKETGYVGLKEKRPNCYLNSLLQTLYHIPFFRKVVYHIPTTEKDMLSGSTTLALQSLFYELQYSDTCVAIKELRKYFTFMQHGALEFNRLICEKLEDKMEGTVLEGRVHELFEGLYISSLECINVDFKCSKWVSFHGLQLDIKGCRDVYASFDKIVQVQCLEGVEKHFTTQHGLQDARRSFLFLNFPRILLLELKRFEYDEWGFITVKVNDRYEYPLQLDLDRDNGKYLSPEADRRVRNLYNLHSVLVHSAVVHSNPYCAFIRPTLSDQWFKFYDERVTEEDTMRALQEQYGGEMKTNLGFNNYPYDLTNYSNAYMLVYIRESDEEDILCSVNEDDLAEHLRSHLRKRKEGKEHKKWEKVERRLYTVIKVARDVDLFEQIGRDIYFGLVDHDKLTSFRIQNQVPFILFKEEVAKEFGIPVQYQRFWLWTKEHYGTYRPLTCEEEQRSVGQLKEVSNEANNTEMKLLLEVELGPDLHPISLPVKKKDDILLFFKLFIPEKHEIRYVGRLFVKGRGKPVDILTKLNVMAGFYPNEDIDLYLEIKFDYFFKCEHIDKKLTFRSSQIKDGDIICFQKCPPPDSLHIDVPLFLGYVYNHQVVRFRSLEKPNEDAFSLELSKLYTYDDIVKHVSRKLLLLDPSLILDDPSKIRLTSHDLQPIKYLEELHLSDMLVCNGQTSDILYYEVLDIPLPELEGFHTLTVAFHSAVKDEVVIHDIRLPKQNTVANVFDALRTKVELSHPKVELRMLGVSNHIICGSLPPYQKIKYLNSSSSSQLHVEEIPEEENNLDPEDHLIPVFQSKRDTSGMLMYFGVPFLLIIHKDETLAEMKVRIQKKLQVPEEIFAKWKFSFISIWSSESGQDLQDSDILSSYFQQKYTKGQFNKQLRVEHCNVEHPGWAKRTHVACQDTGAYLRWIKRSKP